MSLSPQDGVAQLPGLGPARVRALAGAGVHTVADLMARIPLRWVQPPRLLALADAVETAGPVAVLARLQDLQLRRLGQGRTVVEGSVVDGFSRLPVTWFNQPWQADRTTGPWLLIGKVGRWRGLPQLVNPEVLPAEKAAAAGVATPVYPTIDGVPGQVLAKVMNLVVHTLGPAGVAEPLPTSMLATRDLSPLGEALWRLHQGEDPVALRRLVWGELVGHQLLVLARRERRRRRAKPHSYRVDDSTRAAARAVLPFPLTSAQKRVVAEIVGDLRQPGPMARLLHGDVGSGKTLVAALALLVALESGHQVAMMAPTEMLAEQHARTLAGWLGSRYPVVLVTAGRPVAGRSDLAAGVPMVLVGTHALLAPGLSVPRLALVVVDEMHRFGVQQREELYNKGQRPDLLLMSATPIPRSLALSAFGDLDVSTLDELPGNRVPVATGRASAKSRPKVLEKLTAALERGERVFVVVPHIEAGVDGVPSLEVEGRWWGELLAKYGVRCMHGRLDAASQRRALEDFRQGHAQVLVATSIVEVGLDVPEATWMVVDGAEHFGLAQLHQLRGRVGRGSVPGRCVVVHGTLSRTARARLEAFVASRDGFALAQLDLEQRGPGEFLGLRQSGAAPLRWADPLRDSELLENAREDAQLLLRGPERERYLAFARQGLLADPGWSRASQTGQAPSS